MLREIANEEKGVSAVIVALILVVLLGFAALVVDGGVLFQQRRQLQNAVDAAALAGAQQLLTDATQTHELAYLYAEKNGVSRPEVVQNSIVTVFNDYDGVTVKARRRVNLILAPVLGRNFEYVEAQATAIITQIEPEKLWPWGVTRQSYALDQDVILKVGARNNFTGNFMALDFPDSYGGRSYDEYIKYGYCPPLDPNPCPVPPNVSETNPWPVDTETGNLVGPTFDGVYYLFGLPPANPDNPQDIRNPRIGLVPILQEGTWDEVRGKRTVDVIDFAIFYLDDIVEGPAGQVEIHGRFLDWAYGVGRSKVVGQPLEGLIGARLWE